MVHLRVMANYIVRTNIQATTKKEVVELSVAIIQNNYGKQFLEAQFISIAWQQKQYLIIQSI